MIDDSLFRGRCRSERMEVIGGISRLFLESPLSLHSIGGRRTLSTECIRDGTGRPSDQAIEYTSHYAKG
jgi:hypothetical protein